MNLCDSNSLKMIVSAFNIICNGSDGESVKKANDMLTNFRNQSIIYFESLINILSNNQIEMQIRCLSSIEIKNLIKDKKEINLNNSFTKLFEIFLNEKINPIAKQLSVALSYSVNKENKDILKLTSNGLKDILKSKNSLTSEIKFSRSLELLNILFERFSNIEYNEFMKFLSFEFFELLVFIWKEYLNNLFCKKNERFEYQNLHLVSDSLFYIICYGIPKDKFLSKNESIEKFFNDLFNTLSLLVQFDTINNEIKKLFITLTKIFQTCRNLNPFEFLRYLQPFLDFSINTIVNQKLDKKSCFCLLKFVNDIIECKEYKSTHLAAFSKLRKDLNVNSVKQSQNSINKYLSGNKMEKVFEPLLHYLYFSDDEINELEMNQELFYKENFSLNYSNFRSIAIKLFENYSKHFPQKMSNFLFNALKNCLNNLKEEDNFETIKRKINIKYSIISVFSPNWRIIQSKLNNLNYLNNENDDFSIISIIKNIENDILILKNKPLNKIKNAFLLKLSLCDIIFHSKPNIKKKIHIDNLNYRLKILLSLFSDKDLVVQLEAEKCLELFFELDEIKKIIKPHSDKLIQSYISIFSKLEENFSKIYLFKKILNLIIIFGSEISESIPYLTKSLIKVWKTSSEKDNLLKLDLIECFLKLLQIFPQILVQQKEFFYKILFLSTNTIDSNLSYLNEKGFELFEIILIFSSNSPPPLIEQIFKNSFKYFLENERCLETNYKIIENFIFLKGINFFIDYGDIIQKIIKIHLENLKREKLIPIMNCLTLLVRISSKKEEFLLNENLLKTLFSYLINNLSFKDSLNFEVSYKLINIFCYLIYYKYKRCLTLFQSFNKKAMLVFVKIVIDAFERVPLPNIKKNYILALSKSIVTNDIELISLTLPYLLEFAYYLNKIQEKNGKIILNEFKDRNDLNILSERNLNVYYYFINLI